MTMTGKLKLVDGKWRVDYEVWDDDMKYSLPVHLDENQNVELKENLQVDFKEIFYETEGEYRAVIISISQKLTSFPGVSDELISISEENSVIKIDTEELYKLYMNWVNDVAEACDWKTHFGPEEIVNAIANILERNPKLIKHK